MSVNTEEGRLRKALDGAAGTLESDTIAGHIKDLIDSATADLLRESAADIETPEGFDEGVQSLQAALLSRLKALQG